MSTLTARIGARWTRHADPAWLEGWSPAPFALRGGETEVATMGLGPTILLLPSLPGFKETWIACAARLARRFRIVTYDLRVNRSGSPSWEAMIEDLERVADAFAPGVAGVIGHSLGAALALRWTLAHPERVRALALSSAFARVTTPRGHWSARFIEQPLVLAVQRWLPEALAMPLARTLAAHSRWVYDPRCDARVLGLVRDAIRATSPRLAARMVRLAFEHDVRARLREIACPALIVTGEFESRFVRDAAAELMRGIAGAERAWSPGAGHLHPLSNAEWFADSVGAWLGPRMER